MAIELVLHHEQLEKLPYHELKSYLAGLPNAVPEGDDFVFDDEEQGLYVVVQLGHIVEERFHPGADVEQQGNAILIRIPNDPPPHLVEPLAEFALNIARHFGWKVYEGGSDRKTSYTEEQSLARRLSNSLPLPVASTGCLGAFAFLAGILSIKILFFR